MDKFNQAFQLHQQGQLQQAEALYRQVLQAQPNHPDALHLLGLLAFQTGHLQPAQQLIQQAIQLNPSNADYYNNLGTVLLSLKLFNEAISVLQHCLQLNPKQVDAHNNLASAYKQTQQYPLALQHYQIALQLRPNFPQAHFNSGNLYQLLNQPEQQRQSYLTAIQLNPNYLEAHYQLGLLYDRQEQYSDALSVYQQILKIDPKHLDSLMKAANIHLRFRNLEAAIEKLKIILSINPSLANVHNNLASIYLEKGHLALASKHLEQAIQQDPTLIEAYLNLGLSFTQQGQLTKGLEIYRQAQELFPHDPRIFSSILFSSYLQPNYQEQEIFKLYQQWGKQFKIPDTQISSHSNQRLRIGYVSGDFNNHSAARVFQLLFQHHNPQQIEIFAYANIKTEDPRTEILKQLVHHWRSIHNLSDEEASNLIQKDQIDILVDLSGHTQGNRLGVFAQRPAPIQVTGLGYGRTTGLLTIDYLLSDQYIHPPARSRFSSEKVFYLSSLIRWTKPDVLIPIQESPCVINHYPIFGCGNHLFKLNQEVITTWSQILQQLPQAKLYLKTKQFNDENLCEEMFQLFEQLQISRERLQLFGGTKVKEHLEFYNQIDIALDPFPYNGGITVCETSWMGVPTIALKGGTGSGHSVMALLGLEDLVANNTNEYVQIAIRLAQDRQRLQQVRQTLRPTLLASPICNGPLFAREMENVYQIIMQTHGSRYNTKELF